MRWVKRALIPCLCFALAAVPVWAHASWLDDWFDQYVSSGPDYFKGQKRGYYTVGSFSARWSTGGSRPITIMPPYFNVGCGGIDAFLGGMSFAMLPDYLVQKFQALIAAAPAIAFEVALSILSQVLSDKMDVITKIIDALNAIQLDECQIARGVKVAAGKLAEGGTLAEAWSSLKQEAGIDDLWHKISQSVKNEQVQDQQIEKMTQGCPQEVRSILKADSLVEWSLQKSGVPYASELADYVRAYVGDVMCRQTNCVDVEPCPQVATKGSLAEALMRGERWKKTKDGRCILDTAPIAVGGQPYSSILDWATYMIDDIARSITSRTPLSDSAQAFIRVVPAPIYKAIETGILTGDYRSNLAFYANLAAVAAVYRILGSLYGTAVYAVATAKRTIESESQVKENCKAQILESLVRNGAQFLERANAAVVQARQAYAAELEEVLANLSYAKHLAEVEQKVLEVLSSAAGKGRRS